MAEKPSKGQTVEVRLLARTIMQTLPDGSRIERKRGDVFDIDRKLYESDLEPDRGMGRPARGRAFRLLADEHAAEEKKKKKAENTQSRIAAMRDSVRESEEAADQARAQAFVQRAENAQKIADTVTKPLDRTGARRTA